LAEMEDNPNKS